MQPQRADERTHTLTLEYSGTHQTRSDTNSPAPESTLAQIFTPGRDLTALGGPVTCCSRPTLGESQRRGGGTSNGGGISGRPGPPAGGGGGVSPVLLAPSPSESGPDGWYLAGSTGEGADAPPRGGCTGALKPRQYL